MKLNNGVIEKFVCPADKKQAVMWDSEVKGFGCRVTPAGTRTYILQFRVKGTNQERQITIGRHNDPWRVEVARKRAREEKEAMMDGTDPVIAAAEEAERRASKKEENKALSVTLRQVMEHYLENRRTAHGTPLRAASQRDIRRHVESNLATWADAPIANITRDACLTRFAEMTERAPGQANQCFVNLRALCNHARELYADENGGYRILATNPVQRMLVIRKLNKESARVGRIPLERIGHVWNALRQRSDSARIVDERTAADWVSFMLLTGTRRTESGCLLWANVNLDAATYHLPAEVVKNHNGITLPLPAPMVEILKARAHLPAVSDKVATRRRRGGNREHTQFVFPSWGKAGYITAAQATMEAVSKAAGVKVTIHDFRRTLEDLGKQCKVDYDDRKMLLNHLATGVHEKHYANNPSPDALRPAVDVIAGYVLEQARIAGTD